MRATDYLKSQHREVEALFKKIERATGREQRNLFNELAENLTNHAKIEEKIFYPAGKPVDEDMTLEAYEEHDIVKAMIRKINKTKTSDETFMAKVTVLKEVVEHHVKEEEQEYFPECEKKFGRDKLEALGEELESAFERLSGRTRKNSLPKAA